MSRSGKAHTLSIGRSVLAPPRSAPRCSQRAPAGSQAAPVALGSYAGRAHRLEMALFSVAQDPDRSKADRDRAKDGLAVCRDFVGRPKVLMLRRKLRYFDGDAYVAEALRRDSVEDV